MKRTAITRFFSVCLIVLALSVAGGETVHVLQKGETLYSLSRRYNVSVDSICLYNNIQDPSRLKAGQSIKIPSAYIVQSGDTLFGISRKLGITVDELCAANGLQKNGVIKPGQSLLLPAGKMPVPPLPITEETIVIVPPEPKKITDPRSYETRAVDTNVIWPVKASEVNYLSGKLYGVSLTGKKSEKVTSIASGTVISIGPYRGFGQVVFVQSSSDYMYVYAGLESITVRKGDRIDFGAELGILGNDTISGKPSMSLMVYRENLPIDPAAAPRG